MMRVLLGCLVTMSLLPRIAAAEVVAYPLAGNTASSSEFVVTVDGQKIPVASFADAHYAHFAIEGAAVIEIRPKSPASRVSVSPHSYCIEAKVADGAISFPLDRPRHLIVQVENAPKLFILADAVDTNAPQPNQPGVKSVADFGVDNSGKSVQTENIQEALDAVAAQNEGQGGSLIFPAGTYLTGTLNIRSNTTVYLAPGALIQGSDKATDYPVDDGRVEEGTGGEHMTFSRLIHIDNAKNVKLIGPGTIDGAGRKVRLQKRAANLLRVSRSSDVIIEGVVLRNPAGWNTHLLGCDNVTARNVKVMTDPGNANGDGIDPDSCQDVTIEHCFFYCSDDCVAIKSTNNNDILREVKNIRVRDNVMWTKKSAQKVGTETKGPRMHDIVFENNDIVRADRTLYLLSCDGAIVENITARNIRVEHIGGDNSELMFFMEVKKRGGLGLIRDVKIENWTAEKPAPKGSRFDGFSQQNGISNVVFENIVIDGKKAESTADLKLSMKGTQNVTVK